MSFVLVVQRALCETELARFECRIPGETLTLLALRATRPKLGVLPGKLRGAGTRLAWLEGARVLGTDSRGALWFESTRTYRMLTQPRLRIVPTPLEEPLEPLDLEALRARGVELQALAEQEAQRTQKIALRSRLTRAKSRLERRAAKILGDLDNLAALEARAALAPLFLAEAARAKRGQTELTASDWSSGEERKVHFTLDPSRPAQEQLEALFRRAKRARAGRAIAERRWEEAEQRAAALATLVPALESATLEDLRAIIAQAHTIAPKDFQQGELPTRARDPQERALPYREYTTSAGAPIYVGRGGEHNDTLTFRVARPHDLWLHSKDWPGAHVILPVPRGKSAPPEAVLEAAELAAHFSEARGEAVIAIQIAERRYLRKPRGAAKGFVVVSRERVLELRPDAARRTRLLAQTD